jgi:hypothetical protein
VITRAVCCETYRPNKVKQNFVACWSAEQAALLATLLNSQICLDFINATIFTDSKRPITKKLLQRINLQVLLNQFTPAKVVAEASTILARLTQGEPAHWPPALETLLYETTASLHEADYKQLQLGFREGNRPAGGPNSLALEKLRSEADSKAQLSEQGLSGFPTALALAG